MAIEINPLANIILELDVAAHMGRAVNLELIRSECGHGIAYFSQFAYPGQTPPKTYGEVKRFREAQVVVPVERIA